VCGRVKQREKRETDCRERRKERIFKVGPENGSEELFHEVFGKDNKVGGGKVLEIVVCARVSEDERIFAENPKVMLVGLYTIQMSHGARGPGKGRGPSGNLGSLW